MVIMESESSRLHGMQDDGDNPEECDVCSNPFDSQSRRPRCLPCCHTFCTQCIATMIVLGHVSCPKCRERHYATNTAEFPVNFSLESLLKKLRSKQWPFLGTFALSSGQMKPSKETETLGDLIREQIVRAQNIAPTYREMCDRLAENKMFTAAIIDEHKEQMNRMNSKEQWEVFQDLVRENAAILHLQEKRLECLSSLIREGIEKSLESIQLTASLLSLCSMPTQMPTQEEKTSPAIAECDRCICIQHAWLEKCKVTLSDNSVAETSQEVLARTRNALRVTSVTGDIELSRHSSSIRVKDLLKLGEEVKSLLRNGQVFALHHHKETGEGKPRFAKVSFYGQGLLCIHHLQDEGVPQNAKIFSYNELFQSVDPNVPMTFMDLGWDGKKQGRILISLQPADSGRARQFALLCSGVRGPSYANTRLLAVGNRGSPSEFVRGGDYQYNNGTGGASLLPGLRRGGEYWKRQVLGSVMAAGSWGDACSAQFIISTRNPGLAQRDDTIFGQVESGLQVLNAAIKDATITRVNVTDCGIVIPL